MTTQAEILHKCLLELEHPFTLERDRARLAGTVCHEARTLLERDYGLFGDKPADAEQTQDQPIEGQLLKDQGRARRVLGAVGDYLRNAGKRGHGHKAGLSRE